MNLEVFQAASAALFSILGKASWLTPRIGSRSQPLAIVTIPNRDDLVAVAPMSLDQRYIRMSSTAGGVTGDLLTVAGDTWILSRSPDPDGLGLSNNWIGMPLMISAGALAYHADGYPLVEWNGVEWVLSS